MNYAITAQRHVTFALVFSLTTVVGCASEPTQAQSTSSVSTGKIHYYYDPLGRLVQAAAADGTGVQYSYDPVGNITAIRRLAGDALSVVDFAPHTGPIGAPVTIYGSGFDPVAASNTVTFNGTAAPVNSASATTLGVVVPVGATSGKIAVSNALGNAISATDFVVSGASSAPVIVAFTPTVAAVGSTVTLSGANFQSNARDDSVEIGGMPAVVVADAAGPTQTQLKLIVPSATASGPITLSTQFGTAVSATEFFAVPAAVSAGNVEFTGRLSVNGPPLTVTTTGAGKKAVLVFTGAANQGLHLLTQGGNFASAVTADVYNSDGIKIETLSLTNSGITDFTKLLVFNGTYSVILGPGASDHGTVQISLIADVTGTIAIDGDPAPITTVRAGQNARYTFSGTAGQLVTLVLTGNAIDDGNPSTNNSTAISVSSFHDMIASTAIATATSSLALDMALPTDGIYVVTLDPSGLDFGTINAQLRSYVTGPLTMDGSTPVSLSAGQNGRFSFTAQANTGYGLALTGLTFTPARGSLQVLLRKANGALVTSCPFSASGSCMFSPGNFPTTGTYLLDVDPSGLNAASFTAVLSTDVMGTIPIDSGPTPVTIVRPGQNARYSFAGTAGQLVTLVLTGNTLDDGNPSTNNSTLLTVSRPSGSAIYSGAINTVTSALPVDLVLPETGNYSLSIDPAGLDVGTIQAQVKSYVTGPLTVDGSTPVSLSAGQNARLSFTAQANTGYGLALTGLAFTPSSGAVTVVLRKADGTLVSNCSMFSSGSCTFPPANFATIGTYLFDFDPGGMTAATFTAVLSTDATGTVPLDSDPTTVTIARPGQNARYSFVGAAGQLVTLVFTGNTLDDGNSSTNNSTLLTVLRPSGAELFSGAINTVTSALPVDLRLPDAGSYTLVIDPAGLDAGTINTQLKSYITGTLALDTSISLDLSAGRNARYTFAAEAGKGYGLVFSSATLTPSAGAFLNGFLRKLDGTFLAQCMVTAADSCDFGPQNFPTTGNYVLDFDPTGMSAASFTAMLNNDVTGTLTIGGGPIGVTISRPGQNARYSFAGTAGQTVRVIITGNALDDGNPASNHSTSISVFKPSDVIFPIVAGSVATTASGATLTVTLPETGNYSIFVGPTGLDSGSFNLAVQ
ncbi:MAG TPA: IPT/TIG domain-containing protein [Kofleriaceae bacterium]|jgi:YD repeat-containing protein|nr:IPT/TIG domain-containing protein [Kofleriaceae bacterium]